ncbi:MAG: four helix bundle protein [Bacteroidales bacterium]|nr:four helix bundle protein [Bacteroidales bacterium]
MKTHKNLKGWQKSISFVTAIYELTKTFPKDEIYGITSQLRRAAIFIPSNIAEGSARKNTKEFIQFLYVSLGSAAELETQLIISMNLGYIDNQKSIAFQKDLEEILRMISGLIKSLKK